MEWFFHFTKDIFFFYPPSTLFRLDRFLGLFFGVLPRRNIQLCLLPKDPPQRFLPSNLVRNLFRKFLFLGEFGLCLQQRIWVSISLEKSFHRVFQTRNFRFSSWKRPQESFQWIDVLCGCNSKQGF